VSRCAIIDCTAIALHTPLELKGEACCVGQPLWLAILPKREVEGDASDIESLDIFGTAVREELSDENKLEFAVCAEPVDRMLTWSIDFLWPFEESVVDNESYVL